MTLTSNKRPTIGLIEVPATGLYDAEGKWPNGLELRKTTLGSGRNYESTDLRPDEELIQALFGWDGKVGCPLAYIPAERPVFGREAYKKLLP
jgi:hypothetical protein